MSQKDTPEVDQPSLVAFLAKAERRYIRNMLAEKSGSITQTAVALGLSRQGLYKKLRRLGIDDARTLRHSRISLRT